jgi:hypothetical protein
LRRVSSLFKDKEASSSASSNANECFNQGVINLHDAIETNSKESSLPTKSTIKLLSAKMPENDYNQTVPLKVIRKIRQPKFKPNLPKTRYHNVVTIQPPMAPPAMAPDHDFSSVTHIESLVPDVLMGEVDEISPSCEKVHVTDFDEKCKGFKREEVERTKIDIGFYRYLKEIENNAINVQPEISFKEKSLSSSTEVTTKSKPELPSTSQKPLTATITSPNKVKREINKDFMSKIISNESQPDPIISVKQSNQTTITSVSQSEATKSDDKAKNGKVVKRADQSNPSSKILSKIANYTPLKSDDSSWLDDILVVVGESRIQEIDKSLEKIPDMVTGNPIQMENVELRLIIRHLLHKLKVNTIMETIKFENNETGPSKGKGKKVIIN